MGNMALAPRVSTKDDQTIVSRRQLTEGSLKVKQSWQEAKGDPLSIEDLYPLNEYLSPLLSAAFKLIDEAVQLVTEAINYFKEENKIASDDAIQRVQALLPELFCCRALADGFGAIVSSIFQGLRNREGEPLNFHQLVTLKTVLKKIRSEPYIVFDEAVDQIMKLEDVGFTVEPAEFAQMAELLDE